MVQQVRMVIKALNVINYAEMYNLVLQSINFEQIVDARKFVR